MIVRGRGFFQWRQNEQDFIYRNRFCPLSVLADPRQEDPAENQPFAEKHRTGRATEGEGKPERLKHKVGEFSRRIDSENRLVYEFADDTITVKACLGHYDD